MNKKTYIKPTVQVLEIQENHFILAESEGVRISSTTPTQEQRGKDSEWCDDWDE